MSRKLILIDGYGFVFRAFHSMPPLTRPSDNMPIGAVYGFTNMLIRLLDKNKSTHIAVVLDSGGKNFRHDIDPNYKAHRPSLPQELIAQFPIIREVIKAFSINSIEKSGFEADDLIATYAKHAIDQGYEDVIVVSSDKDLLQLLVHGITIYDAVKDKIITEDDVFAKFGVAPKYLLDVFALIGDNSDNIPGVRGIGPKTACELINDFGSIDGIYSNLEAIKQDKRRQTLIDDQDNARLSYRLIDLKYDAPMDYSLDQLLCTDFDHQQIVDFVAAQGFKSLASKFSRMPSSTQKATPAKIEGPEFVIVDSCADLAPHIKNIYKCGWLAFLITENEIYLSYAGASSNLKIEFSQSKTASPLFGDVGQEQIINDFFGILNEIFTDEAVVKITLNSKYLYKYNPKFTSIEDVAIMAYAVETGRNNGNDLASLAQEFTPEYTEANSFTVYNIYQRIKENFIKDQFVVMYQRIDRPLPKAIALMESRGVLIDVKYLNKLSKEFGIELTRLEKEIFELTGQTFNLASPKQLGEILFDHLKLPGGKKSKLGAYATGVKILETLDEKGYKVASLILKWREFSKLISTYTDALPKSVNPKTQRVHSTFLLTSTATGRFASINPNLQNIPIRTEQGQRIRKAFIAKANHKIISADYSQIELRLLAHYAGIEPLKEAFNSGQDVHAITATQIFNVSLDQVTSILRRQAKTINFGIIYGISGFGLAKRLDMSMFEAKSYIEKYFKQYPGIKDYMDRTIEFAKNHGYVLNIFGRKCMLPMIKNSSYTARGFAERAAINAPLQSSAADIIKKAIVCLPEDIAQYLILQIHDELLFEVPEDMVEAISLVIKRTMESVIALSVPLTVDVSHGGNWSEAH